MIRSKSADDASIVTASKRISLDNPKDVETLAKDIENRKAGGINILVNNAGITKEAEQKEKISSVDYKSVDLVVHTFLLGNGRESWHETLDTYLTSQHFVTAALIKGHSSSVVNISGISGKRKTHSSGQFAYLASKAGFTQLSRILARTLYLPSSHPGQQHRTRRVSE